MHTLIIGAGAAGSMAAWRIAQAGHQVTVLEQFTLDHDQGSSFGESRIVRRVYPDALYTELMAEAYSLWDELQTEWTAHCRYHSQSDSLSDAELIRRSGGLFFGPSGNADVAAAESALFENGVPFEKLNAREVESRFPQFSMPADTCALFEPTMGYARASRSVHAAAVLAERSGAQFVENAEVTDIAPAAGGVVASTRSGERYRADRLLITAGAWTGRFLGRLGVCAPFEVTRQVYLNLKPAHSGSEFDADRFPTWIDIGANIYGFPHLGTTPGVKMASHNRGIAVDPNSVERDVTSEDIDSILTYAAAHFPGLSQEVVYQKVCLYTNTPCDDFLIDAAPNLPGAYVISACSGHGFKFAPLIGEIGADLALNRPHRRNLTRFGLRQFS